MALHRLASAEAEVALEETRIKRYALRADGPGEVLDVHVEARRDGRRRARRW